MVKAVLMGTLGARDAGEDVIDDGDGKDGENGAEEYAGDRGHLGRKH